MGGNVTTGALPATQFTLAAGIYDCDISAQVFDLPAGFSLVFRNTAGTLSFPIGSGFTQSGTSATVNAKARFNITAPTSFQLQQFCPNAPADANNPFRMGIPTESYAAGNIFTQITCVRNR